MAVADNTGAQTVRCIHVRGGSRPRPQGTVGDVIRASVQTAQPGSDLKPGDLVLAVVVRTKRYRGGVRFADNAVVLVNENGEPRGTRVRGPVPRSRRDAGFGKLLSRAGAVV